MKTRILVLTLLAALLLGAVSPSVTAPVSAASRVHSHPALFDKTRFVFWMGAAYFAFHHFVWNRYREGAFQSGAPNRTRSIVKAGIALLFAYLMIKHAFNIAVKSNSRTLHALIRPLQILGLAMGRIGTRFKRGQYSDTDVTALNRGADS